MQRHGVVHAPFLASVARHKSWRQRPRPSEERRKQVLSLSVLTSAAQRPDGRQDKSTQQQHQQLVVPTTMVAIVKKKRTSRRPNLMVPTDSISSMRSTTERSVSSNSLKKGNTEACHTKFSAVSFAQDYGCSDTVWPPAPPMTAEEVKQCFYNVSSRWNQSEAHHHHSTQR